MLCVKCQKRPAVVFVQRLENGKTVQEGYCLTCARAMHIQPVDDLMKQFGMSDQDLENMEERMSSFLQEASDSGMLAPMMNGDDTDAGDEPAPQDDFVPGGSPVFPFGFGARQNKDDAKSKNGKKEKAPRRKFLETYCENLTQKARDGKTDRIIGRDREIYRTIQILCRRQKNNPCLIGEAGVGKTAIAEGIAQRIAEGKVPARLQDKEIYLLDMTSLVAGTQFRGQFEQRVKGLISEVKAAGNIILFIDEIHSIVGAGDSDGSMNAANIMKPALSRGQMQVIGATTFAEYRKYIEKDSALERRFQPVKVEEPSLLDTIEVIKGIRVYYEKHHFVRVSDPIVTSIVKLSERYITDRFLPDKAIDLLDESCACCNLRHPEITELMETQRTVADLETREHELENPEPQNGQDAAIDYEALAAVKTDLAKQREKLPALQLKVAEIEVTMDDVAQVIELWTGVPAVKIKETEYGRLQGLEDALKAHIIGQDEAVHAVAGAIKRARADLSGRHRPASFIFVGPTGVGKTELVKQLASQLFDTVDPLISIDMSEYMEKYAVSRLIGSPPGYVGYDEGGQLTKAVRQKPYSVVLFDEIEKAHPDVFNILLQILEEGRLTDAQGRTVDFRNTVIIMTSNVGAREIAQTTPLGFSGNDHAGLSDKEIKSRVMAEMKKLFRPEFLNRIDEIIVFKSLTDEQIAQIVELMVADLRERMIAQNMSINLTPAATKLIAKEGTDTTFGARPLRRAIQRLLEDPLSEQILEGKWQSGSIVDVDVDESGENLEFKQGSGVVPAPRKRDSIARDAELLLTNYDLGHAGLPSAGSGGGTASGGAAD